MPSINRLLWDDWNVAHIARHGITRGEVDEVHQGPYELEETYGRRFLVMGPTLMGRMLTIIVAPIDEGAYYVVSARSMRRRERRRYDELREEHAL